MKKSSTLRLQISSGRGPAECRRAVYLMVEYLRKQSDREDCGFTLADVEPCSFQPCCFHSAVVDIAGVNLQWAEALVGSHLWICASPFRAHHKRKNWYFSVSKMEESEVVQIVERDVRYEPIRASGPGGQHVNKASTAVRATWVRDGTSCVASDERSQYQNRRLALARLRALIGERNAASRREARQSAWREHDALERGRPVLTFRGRRFRL